MHDTRRTRDRLAADLRSVMDDVDALARASTDQASGEVVALRERIRDRLDTARERMLDVRDEAVLRAQRARDATDDYVHDNPWRVVAGAAALGVAIGLLMRRR